MSELEAEIAKIKITESSYVTTAALSTQSLDANYGEFNNVEVNTNLKAKSLIIYGSAFSLSGNNISIKSKDVVVSVSGKATSEIAVRDASGTIIGTAISGYRVSYSTETIGYLGWEVSED